jgi:hypothetical protein
MYVIWQLRLSEEVMRWYENLSEYGIAEAENAFERIRTRGNTLRMPHSRSLSGGLFELRFTCENTATRITYVFDPHKQIITLTQFTKQKNNEQREILRARKAQKLIEIQGKGEKENDGKNRNL